MICYPKSVTDKFPLLDYIKREQQFATVRFFSSFLSNLIFISPTHIMPKTADNSLSTYTSMMRVTSKGRPYTKVQITLVITFEALQLNSLMIL